MHCCTGSTRCDSWCSGLVGEQYWMVSLESDSDEKEVEGTDEKIGDRDRVRRICTKY